MYPILFRIGPITIYSYGFFLFLAVLFTYLTGKKRAREIKLKESLFFKLYLTALIAGLIGSRIAYILINWSYFLETPFQLLFGRGGFAFLGGLILALTSLFWAAKKNKIEFLKITGLFALIVPLGHGLGRLGCFFNGCCHGIPTQSWLGVKFPINSAAQITSLKVFPTQLISSLFLFSLFFFLFLIRNKVGPAKLTAFYLLFYGFFRFLIEFWRDDTAEFLFLPGLPQLISLFAIIFALILLKRK